MMLNSERLSVSFYNKCEPQIVGKITLGGSWHLPHQARVTLIHPGRDGAQDMKSPWPLISIHVCMSCVHGHFLKQ